MSDKTIRRLVNFRTPFRLEHHRISQRWQNYRVQTRCGLNQYSSVSGNKHSSHTKPRSSCPKSRLIFWSPLEFPPDKECIFLECVYSRIDPFPGGGTVRVAPHDATRTFPENTAGRHSHADGRATRLVPSFLPSSIHPSDQHSTYLCTFRNHCQ